MNLWIHLLINCMLLYILKWILALFTVLEREIWRILSNSKHFLSILCTNPNNSFGPICPHMYASLVNDPLLSFLNSIYCIQIKETIQLFSEKHKNHLNHPQLNCQGRCHLYGLGPRLTIWPKLLIDYLFNFCRKPRIKSCSHEKVWIKKIFLNT